MLPFFYDNLGTSSYKDQWFLALKISISHALLGI
jgi:hypothetical protein